MYLLQWKIYVGELTKPWANRIGNIVDIHRWRKSAQVDIDILSTSVHCILCDCKLFLVI